MQDKENKESSQKALFAEELKRPVKHVRSKVLLQYLQPVDWILENVTTLFHWAVVQNNGDLIKTCLLDRIGMDVNADISFGNTALLLALKMHSLEVLKVLLDADADVLVIDPSTGKTALNIFMINRGQVIEYIDVVPHLINNLKRSKLDIETLVASLIAADCPFEYVRSMKDPEVSEEFIKRNPLGNYSSAMSFAMDDVDLKHVELILRYGDQSAKWTFYKTLHSLYLTGDMWKVFLKGLSYWNLISEEGLVTLDYMYRDSNKQNVQLLLDLKIHEQVRDKFGIDLRTSIFGNWKVNPLELLKNSDFRTDAPGLRQRTALHCAVNARLDTVEYLLDTGANVNVKDDRGRTPIFECTRLITGQLLLARGAEVQIIDNFGLTLFEYLERTNTSLLKMVIPQLAINRVLGHRIKKSIKKVVNSNEIYKSIYEMCCRQLRDLKRCDIETSLSNGTKNIIFKRVSFFKVLIEKIDVLSQFITSLDPLSLFKQYTGELHWLYNMTLTIKLIKASNLFCFKFFIARRFCQYTKQQIDFDDPLVDKFSKYMCQKDIDEFAQAYKLSLAS